MDELIILKAEFPWYIPSTASESHPLSSGELQDSNTGGRDRQWKNNTGGMLFAYVQYMYVCMISGVHVDLLLVIQMYMHSS